MQTTLNAPRIPARYPVGTQHRPLPGMPTWAAYTTECLYWHEVPGGDGMVQRTLDVAAAEIAIRASLCR